MLKNYIHPISFSLSCMHVLFNDFLNFLIIGLNVTSHHKLCGSGSFFSLLMLLIMAI